MCSCMMWVGRYSGLETLIIIKVHPAACAVRTRSHLQQGRASVWSSKVSRSLLKSSQSQRTVNAFRKTEPRTIAWHPHMQRSPARQPLILLATYFPVVTQLSNKRTLTLKPKARQQLNLAICLQTSAERRHSGLTITNAAPASFLQNVPSEFPGISKVFLRSVPLSTLAEPPSLSAIPH